MPDSEWLTEEEQLQILDAIWARTSMKSGYPNTEWGIDFAAFESIVARHRAAAWDECHESGTPWDNPYAPPAEKGSEG